MRRVLVAGLLLLLLSAGFVAMRFRRPSLTLSASSLSFPADGRMHRGPQVRLTRGGVLHPEDLALSGFAARAEAVPGGTAGLWLRAPVNPGGGTVSIRYRGRVNELQVTFTPTDTDSAGDGTPDFLRLHRAADRAAFRAWFTTLADTAAALPADRLPKEIDDCAALLRWCYRGALHVHDEAWQQMVPVGDLPPLASVEQYAYPQTPLGTALFRVRPGPYTAADPANGSFAQFADARTLWLDNTFPVSRNIAAARPGDLLFYRQLEQNSPYHSMIVTGRRHDWVVYHTGPVGSGTALRPGEVRRMTLDDLLHHPESRWRPIPQNANFLGVYRWNILREDLP